MTRDIPLVTGEFYHVYNRGTAKLPTFINDSDYKQAQLTATYYQFKELPVKLSRFKALDSNKRSEILESIRHTGKIVDIISYVFMPNHFHFLLRQAAQDGVSKFVGQFSNSYTRYFNTKHSRPGSLFQGTFKAVHIETENQLLHVSRYIHLNPFVSAVIKKEELPYYYWSSYPDYLRGQSDLVDVTSVMSRFKSPMEYQSFVLNHSDYAQQLEIIKHQLID